MRVNEAGQLEVTTPVGGFGDEKPYAYQDVDGRRVEVAVSCELERGNYGFRVGPYDRRRPLILDPAVLVYAGYIGGRRYDDDWLLASRWTAAGNAYVTGYTDSAEATFPVTVGPDLTLQRQTSPSSDAFVAKVSATGTGLVYAGYIGGGGNDVGHGIAVDAAGNAYVTGAHAFHARPPSR